MRRCKAKLFFLVVSKVDDAFMKPPNYMQTADTPRTLYFKITSKKMRMLYCWE